MDLLPEKIQTNGVEPEYETDEVRTAKQAGVHVYSTDHSFKSAAGVAWVTTCRIIWFCGKEGGAVRLQNLMEATAEGGGIFGLGLANSPKISIAGRSVDGSVQMALQLAFKDGGRDEFLAQIQAALKLRQWEVYKAPTKTYGTKFGTMAGISKRAEQEVKEAEQTISGAFGDLDGLMNQAKEMVELASQIAARAAKAPTNVDDGDELGSMLASAGIDNPVTRDTAGASYYQDLARQLAKLLEEPLTRSHGVMTLTDVYCCYNSARGIGEMVSPDDLVQACKTFDTIGVPFRTRSLRSGVTVLESGIAREDHVDARLKSVVKTQGHISLEELASLSGMSLYVAKEQLEGAEARGLLARDQSVRGFGIRYYSNLLLEQ